MTAGTRRLVVVSSGLRAPSSTRMLADRLAEATVGALTEQGVEVQSTVIEVREHATDLASMLLTGFATPALQASLDELARADGVVAVTPIFNGSYAGLFKTFFDVVEDGALAGTPMVLGATAGTARHSLALEHALRPLMTYLRAVVVPTSVFAATEDFGSSTRRAAMPPGETLESPVRDEAPPLSTRVDRAARELAALVAARPERTVADPFGDPVPFEQMLRGARD